MESDEQVVVASSCEQINEWQWNRADEWTGVGRVGADRNSYKFFSPLPPSGQLKAANDHHHHNQKVWLWLPVARVRRVSFRFVWFDLI